ncbi:molybdenum cofactor guanylyltransferase [Candidatus Bathyarchaeota archaeon]|jgi:molybdenum cofactor guanylyltransferase|nr:molybdenum cofactor guanylyltransferase [Candidatus Bathyarchaeota archaeon]MBT4319286.1 molybdenum cofactor guanylyltransferase [Candidatus Bathyarchaeota archaeon]MBT4422898.1 molybdenum cofactor guanylyltransferase [Candidatus Bathyarchaeota archaeon]MBT6603864.1 molybdenum cofactor guanylyltransferase [Candidatus Bathyarchaeota archaeon]MBT7187018.1 molybdenum cofactor guanylyltransferase [Candidatus Bathyarchaeota archaeon]
MRTGIILAGGESKRIGTDKGLIDLNGKPLIRYVVESLRPIVDEIIVVVGSKERIQHYRNAVEDDVMVVPDLYDDGSPMIGLITGLTHAKGDYAVVAACDMPFINSELVDILFLLSFELNGTLLIKPDGWIEPLPAVYNVEVGKRRAVQLRNDGDLRLRKVLETLPSVARILVERLKIIDPELRSFFDLDTMERYDEAMRIIKD